MQTGLKLWSDAYNQYRQVIMGLDKTVLYERYCDSELFETVQGLNVTVSGWRPWRVVAEEHSKISKAWFIRDLTVDDLILGNFFIKE